MTACTRPRRDLRRSRFRPPVPSTDLLLLMMSTIWGVNFTVIKTALDDFSPLSFNAVRFLIASTALYLVFRHRHASFTIQREHLRSLIGLGILANTIYQVAFIEGVARSRAGNAALILATTPIFVAVLSSIGGQEKLDLRSVIGVLLSFTGIALIIGDKVRDIAFGQTLFGDLLLLLATLCWSVYTVGLKRFTLQYGAMQSTVVTMIAGTVPLVMISLPWLQAERWAAIRPMAWAGLLFSALGAIVFCFVVWNYGVQQLGGTRTAVYSNVSPIIAMIAAWIGLNERPTPGQLVGAAVILLGLYLVRVREDIEITT